MVCDRRYIWNIGGRIDSFNEDAEGRVQLCQDTSRVAGVKTVHAEAPSCLEGPQDVVHVLVGLLTRNHFQRCAGRRVEL